MNSNRLSRRQDILRPAKPARPRGFLCPQNCLLHSISSKIKASTRSGRLRGRTYIPSLLKKSGSRRMKPFSSLEGWIHPLTNVLLEGELLSLGIMEYPSPTLETCGNIILSFVGICPPVWTKLAARGYSQNSSRFLRDTLCKEVCPRPKHPRKRADGGMYVGGLHICEPVSPSVCNEAAWL